MKNVFRNRLLVLVVSAFCASSAFADDEMQGVGQVMQNNNGEVVKQTQGAVAKNMSKACKNNPNSQACANAKNAGKNRRTELHNQRIQNAQSQQSQ